MSRDVKKLIKPYAARVRLRVWLLRFGAGCCAASAAGLTVMLLSFAVPIVDRAAIAAEFAAGVLLVLGAAFAFMRPSQERLAALIDGCGFKERVQTMLALHGDDSAFAALQRRDTISALAAANPKDRVPLTVPKRLFAIAAAILLAACALGFVPGPKDAEVRELKEIREVMREQAELVEAGLEALQKEDSLADAEKAELNERLRELAETLREGRDYKESMRQISEIEKELEEIRREQAEEQIAALERAVDEARGEEPAGAEEKLRELAESLRKDAEEMQDAEAKEAMEKLADALESGDEAAAEEALSELENALPGSQTLAKIESDLKLGRSRLGRLPGAQPFTGDPANLVPIDADSLELIEAMPGDAGDTASAGVIAVPGQGQGDQSGNGQSGNGAGGGAGSGTGELEESEKIYDSRRIETEGPSTGLQGEIDAEGPRQQAETEAGDGSLDGYIPYREAVGGYADDEINAARREALPPAVREWVEGYFSALQGQ